MYGLIVVTIGIIATLSGLNANFPTDPKPCTYGDSACIMKIINFLLHRKGNSYVALNLGNLNPLVVSVIDVKQGNESPVNINLKLNNTQLFGVRSSEVYDLKGFGKDLTQKHEFRLKAPIISLIGDYTITGKVLILPISGSGKSNITLENVDLAFSFWGESFEKDGATYMKLRNTKLIGEITRAYFDFRNLFNGDKALGDNMNLFLNENWMDIYGELKASFLNVFSEIFESVINNVFMKYPYDKMFFSE